MLAGLGGGPALWRRGPTDGDVATWADAVAANSGTVSSARAAQNSDIVRGMKNIGSYQLASDILWLAAENAAQAFTSWKLLLLATVVGSPAPVFTVDRGFTPDGVQSYLNWPFTPSVNGSTIGGTSLRTTVYERTPGAAGYAAAVSSGGTINLGINPGTGAPLNLRFKANSALTATGLIVADSRGYKSAGRNGPTFFAYDRGVSAGAVTPPSNGSVLSTRSIYIGAQNNAGTADSFRGAQQALVMISAPAANDAAYAAEAAVIQAGMAALGAAV